MFVDFRERTIQNTVPSILLLGRIFAKEAQAQAYVDVYTREMQKVYTLYAQGYSLTDLLVPPSTPRRVAPVVEVTPGMPTAQVLAWELCRRGPPQ